MAEKKKVYVYSQYKHWGATTSPRMFRDGKLIHEVDANVSDKRAQISMEDYRDRETLFNYKRNLVLGREAFLTRADAVNHAARALEERKGVLQDELDVLKLVEDELAKL